MRLGKKPDTIDDPIDLSSTAAFAPPPPSPAPVQAPDTRTAILCDEDRHEITRITADRQFRVTHEGRVYEHVGEDADGRWIYARQ